MAWTLRDAERDRKIIQAIEGHDDRSAAILATAYLEDRLMRGIRVRLVDDAKVVNSLFEGMEPLSSLDAKINLAYLMDMFDKNTMHTLHVIRRIRNLFAHNIESLDFATPRIKDLCDNLYYIADFNRMKAGMITYIETSSRYTKEKEFWRAFVMQLCDSLISRSDTPRNAFMNTIQLILFTIELMSLAEMKAVTAETHSLTIE